jgi:hypothetical protein
MKKKINKFLDKKIYMGEAIGNTIFIFGLIVLCHLLHFGSPAHNFRYEDMHGNIGKSKNCYKTKNGLYCNADIKVEWYGEE